MAEHWCKEHKQAFFKKGKMKGYAHPILEVDGEPTGEWCNEPDTGEGKSKEPKQQFRGRDEDKTDIRTFIMEIGADWRGGMRSEKDLFVKAREILLQTIGHLEIGEAINKTETTDKTNEKVLSDEAGPDVEEDRQELSDRESRIENIKELATKKWKKWNDNTLASFIRANIPNVPHATLEQLDDEQLKTLEELLK